MSESDTRNPKEEGSSKDKLMFSAIPWRSLYGPALVMTYGACKYGLLNFRVQGDIKSSMYFNSTMRHLIDWWEGRDDDEESGLHPLDHVIAGLLVLRDGMRSGRWKDDRPPGAVEAQEELEEANEETASILEEFGGIKLPPEEWEPVKTVTVREVAEKYRDQPLSDPIEKNGVSLKTLGDLLDWFERPSDVLQDIPWKSGETGEEIHQNWKEAREIERAKNQEDGGAGAEMIRRWKREVRDAKERGVRRDW